MTIHKTFFVLVVSITVLIALLGCGRRYRSNNLNHNRPDSLPHKQYHGGMELPLITSKDFIIIHSAYIISYNSNTLTASWVAYELTASETDGPWTRKGLRFVPDPDCSSKQADNEDYRNSGFSRGHLAPAGDMKWDSVAMLESFYFTNCIPQRKELNNGKWNQLENKTRLLAKQYGRIYVVCGPAFLGADTLRIGNNGIAVPDACFKALLAPVGEGYSAIAFLMRNDDEERSVKECAVTVDELETLLGLDLFCNMPDEVEEEVESKVIWEDWKLK